MNISGLLLKLLIRLNFWKGRQKCLFRSKFTACNSFLWQLWESAELKQCSPYFSGSLFCQLVLLVNRKLKNCSRCFSVVFGQLVLWVNRELKNCSRCFARFVFRSIGWNQFFKSVSLLYKCSLQNDPEKTNNFFKYF